MEPAGLLVDEDIVFVKEVLCENGCNSITDDPERFPCIFILPHFSVAKQIYGILLRLIN